MNLLSGTSFLGSQLQSPLIEQEAVIRHGQGAVFRMCISLNPHSFPAKPEHALSNGWISLFLRTPGYSPLFLLSTSSFRVTVIENALITRPEALKYYFSSLRRNAWDLSLFRCISDPSVKPPPASRHALAKDMDSVDRPTGVKSKTGIGWCEI